MRPAITTVLFDFHGTVFQVEDERRWVRRALGILGFPWSGSPDVSESTLAGLAAAYQSAGRPGGQSPVGLTDDEARLYEERDLTAEAHRAVYCRLMSRVDPGLPGVTAEAMATALYERQLDPDGWLPYPDAYPALSGLRAAGIRTVLVSNIGFDLRPILARHGFEECFDAVLLSYEHEVMKPDPRFFRLALEAVGAVPESALMVGDSPADGGAVTLGIRSVLLPTSPPGAVHGLAALEPLIMASRT